MNKLNRRNFLKGLGLSGLGLGLFGFSLKEDEMIELPEIDIPLDMPMFIHYGVDTASSGNVTYTVSSNADRSYTYVSVNNA